MKAVFYITNHGFGHASRNAALIQRLLQTDPGAEVIIKSDPVRCAFLRRNLEAESRRVTCYEDCFEVGFVLKEGSLQPDPERMREMILQDRKSWPDYIEREKRFLRREQPDVVVSDVICWALPGARQCGIRTVLIGNFTWASLYRSFFDESVYGPYLEYYRMADLALWYEIHDPELETYVENHRLVSLVSRKVNPEKVREIRARYRRPVIFVSLGGSAEISRPIDVSACPFDFVTTRGIRLTGDNVHSLPADMINTQDYISASEYVIAKGGWSTVAEILLQRKRCCLLMRGSNREDDMTRAILTERQHCAAIGEADLRDPGRLIAMMQELRPAPYRYFDSAEEICGILREFAG